MGRLSAIVLGSAAGGGFPQWNCACEVCRLAWSGDARVKRRSQASLAVTAGSLFMPLSRAERDGSPMDVNTAAAPGVARNGESSRCVEPFVLVNASPDLREQIIATPGLHPRGLRDSPIAAVVLTGAEIDQTAGLLTLRERGSFELCGTQATLSTLAANSIFGALAAAVVTRKPVNPGTSFRLPGGLEAELFLVPGKTPLYLEGDSPDLAAETEADVSVSSCRASGARLVFIPGAA